MELVKKYFEDHPISNECFETADGFIFHKDGDAALHAKGLTSKEVSMHTRAAVAGTAEIVEGETEPVITEMQEHKVPGGEENDGTVIPAQSIQIPVSPEIKKEVNVLESATGNPITSTAGVTNTPGENHMPQTIIGEPVATATGQNVANVNDGSKPLSQAEQKAAEKEAKKAEKEAATKAKQD